jgi:phosphoribosylanthranilate isomerase
MRTRVKICGITREEDGRAAALSGADAIGLVFYPPSPRAVRIEHAARIVAGLPPFVSVVALFVNPGKSEVRSVLDAVRIDLLQFHGDEPAEACEGFGLPYLKAVRVRESAEVTAAARRHPRAAGLLLDAYDAGRWGGTGHTFDWSLVPAGAGLPLILAGGLSPANVADAVRTARPYAVDVSGGVESAPGVKDPRRIEAFIDEVNRVEAG